MLPVTNHLVKEPPSGDEWLHELKFDGYRMLCRVDRSRVTVWSRNGKDWTERFQNVVEVVKSLKTRSAIFDGEIVMVDAQGRSSFQKLQRAMGKATTTGFAYEVFDLIYLTVSALLKLPPASERTPEESRRSNSHGVIRYSEHISGNGEEFFETCLRVRNRRNRFEARQLSLRIDAQSELVEGEVCEAAGVCDRGKTLGRRRVSLGLALSAFSLHVGPYPESCLRGPSSRWHYWRLATALLFKMSRALSIVFLVRL